MDASSAPTPRNAHRTARAEAAAWIVRLHGPLRSPELEAAFRDWLAAHPENGKQFERVTEVWDAGSSVPVPGAPRLARWKESLVPRQWTLAAAVLLVACGLAVWGAWRVWANPTYTTGIGEQRIVRLDDGTRLSLNSGTRVRIAYNDSERRVELERGEAYFEVAHNPARPFIVTAGNHQVTALGTVFVVRYETAQTAVTLLEGKVTVLPVPDSPSLTSRQLPRNSPLTISEDSTGRRSARANRPPSISLPPSPSDGAGPEVRIGAKEGSDQEFVLSPGERVTFTRGGSPKLDEPRMEAVTAWRRGEVMLDNTELADAIAELNRYDKTKLIIDDPKIAALPISGIYQAGDSNSFARTVAKLYDLEIIEQPNRIYLRAAAEH
jgi:transmembrane sensor